MPLFFVGAVGFSARGGCARLNDAVGQAFGAEPTERVTRRHHRLPIDWGIPGRNSVLSGRWDSNPRPLGPEPSALARLRHAPEVFNEV